MTSSPCIHPVSVWGKKAFLGPSASREDVITRYKNKKDVISLQSAGVKSSGQAGFNTERHVDTKIVCFFSHLEVLISASGPCSWRVFQVCYISRYRIHILISDGLIYIDYFHMYSLQWWIWEAEIVPWGRKRPTFLLFRCSSGCALTRDPRQLLLQMIYLE